MKTMTEAYVLGAGNREEAIAEAIGKSPELYRVVVTGNVSEVLETYANKADKPFIVFGPEALLIAGWADTFRDEGYVVFGASKAAAHYEDSKSKAIKMAAAAGIVQPDFYIAEGRGMSYYAFSHAFDPKHKPDSYVIKADRTAHGKGVVLPSSYHEAHTTIEDMIYTGKYDGAGNKIIVFQKRVYGSEVTVQVIVGSGKDDFLILPHTQDHKRLKNGDKGRNTGGMGAYGSLPSSIVSPERDRKLHEKVYASLEGMDAEGVKYKHAVLNVGVLFPDDETLVPENESYLIEYNVRFGDPEAQVIFALLPYLGVDCYRLLRSAAEGSLEVPAIDLKTIGTSAVSVVLAAENYPDEPKLGAEIYGLNQSYENVVVHEGAVEARRDGRKFTVGGRVLDITGVGETIDQAANSALAAIGETAVHFSGMQYRTDIGYQARNNPQSA
jgi:phosphoribosylamine--glycine ligase